MSITIELTPVEERRVKQMATRAGVSVTEFARLRLLQQNDETQDSSPEKPAFDWDKFVASLPPPRPVEEIDAHIADVEAMRDEWDKPANSQA